MRYVERIAAIVCLVLTAAILGTLAYWQFFQFPGPPVTVEWSKLDREVYRQGDVMHIQRKMCILAPRQAYVVHRAFVDHIVFSLADFNTKVPETGCAVRSIDIEVPPSLPPGLYHYVVSADFSINPIKSVSFDYPDLGPITVIARDEH